MRRAIGIRRTRRSRRTRRDLDPVQTLAVLCRRGHPSETLPAGPRDGDELSGGSGTSAFRRLGSGLLSPSVRWGQACWRLFSGSGGYFWPSCLDKADSAKITVPYRRNGRFAVVGLLAGAPNWFKNRRQKV